MNIYKEDNMIFVTNPFNKYDINISLISTKRVIHKMLSTCGYLQQGW
jgi:hypothetical protein